MLYRITQNEHRTVGWHRRTCDSPAMQQGKSVNYP